MGGSTHAGVSRQGVLTRVSRRCLSCDTYVYIYIYIYEGVPRPAADEGTLDESEMLTSRKYSTYIYINVYIYIYIYIYLYLAASHIPPAVPGVCRKLSMSLTNTLCAPERLSLSHTRVPLEVPPGPFPLEFCEWEGVRHGFGKAVPPPACSAPQIAPPAKTGARGGGGKEWGVAREMAPMLKGDGKSKNRTLVRFVLLEAREKARNRFQTLSWEPFSAPGEAKSAIS